MPSYQFAKVKPAFVTFTPLGDFQDTVQGATGLTFDEFKYEDNIVTVVTASALTAQQQTDVGTAITNYTFLDVEGVQSGALAQAKNIPGWATWDESQALDWHDTNVKTPIDDLQASIAGITSLATALPVLEEMRLAMDKMETENRAVVRMIIALRNKSFPNLEGS